MVVIELLRKLIKNRFALIQQAEEQQQQNGIYL